MAPKHQGNICVFERNGYVGGRAYDVAYDGKVPPAYSEKPVAPLGAIRFYDNQQAIKDLANELEILYHTYAYQNSLIKSRGRWFTSNNEMCVTSYVGLNCRTDGNGLDSADQLWSRLIEIDQSKSVELNQFGDFGAFCRHVLGDEATEFLRDSFRFRSDFSAGVLSYMQYFSQEWNVAGTIHYPTYGMSQFSKRMISIATEKNRARLYLHQNVEQITEHDRPKNDYIFKIETTDYTIRAKQIVAAMDPPGWSNIRGTLADAIKKAPEFQAIQSIPVVSIQCFWPRRWWEESSKFASNIDRAWTRQNCISFIEINSRHPELEDLNLTRAVYDDGTCVSTWTNLIERNSNEDLIAEIVRGLGSIFTDVTIPQPTKIFTHIWPAAWHWLNGKTLLSNTDVAKWSLQPLKQFKKHQLSLVGEAFYIDRSGWSDAAIKSSLNSLTSQFDMPVKCLPQDSASDGKFCSNELK